MQILIKPDLDELSHAAAEMIIKLACESLEASGRFSIALAGGSTPRNLYLLLASPKYRYTVDWPNVTYIIGDERNVAPAAPESNFRMVKESLLDPLRVPTEKVMRWETELGEVSDVAAHFEASLERVLEPNGRIDLVLLGLGSDGHTASLFPRTPALREERKLATENWVEGLNDYRFTLTFRAINDAADVIFLVSGSEKASAVAKVIDGEYTPDDLPAQRVLPKDGKLVWLLDEAAATQLGARSAMS
jgi:6-phosphogluconolactonase